MIFIMIQVDKFKVTIIIPIGSAKGVFKIFVKKGVKLKKMPKLCTIILYYYIKQFMDDLPPENLNNLLRSLKDDYLVVCIVMKLYLYR